ncbi:MAG: TrmB family transcriptional regulator [Anaerolineales bacterium]|nr:TrmB family transcriptional regulator [Anaerolineales bacterium]
MTSLDLIHDLMALGFTEYESRVYVALLGDNPATGYQVSKQAGIPRSMVYEALGRLSGRGAVLKTGDERATLYRPLPPDVLLDRVEQEQENRLSNLRESLRTLYEVHEEERLWSIRGADSILAYAAQMIQRAEVELLLVLDDSHLEILSTEVLEVDERGVMVGTLLTGEGELGVGQVAQHPPLESELQELVGMLVVVIDRREALIASGDGELVATITNNRHLVLLARQFIWMELFAQRIYQTLSDKHIDKLDPEDQRILMGYSRAIVGGEK